MIIVGCVDRGRTCSSPCRLTRSRTRRASTPVTPGAGEVVLLVCPILPIWMNYLFKYSFDFSITYLYLPIHLGVVWHGDTVVYSVLLQQCPEVRVVEV